jgi:hypothetical protein
VQRSGRLAFGFLQLPRGDLPVEDGDIERIGANRPDHDGLRRQAPVVEAVAVRGIQCFGNGADELQPLPEIEVFPLRPDEVVESLKSFVVLKDQGGPVLAVDEV